MLHKQVQGKVKKLFTELKTRNGKGKCAESGRENRATVFGAIEAKFQTLDGDLKAACAPCLYWRLYFVKHFASTQEILNNRHHIRDRSNEIEILCEILYLIKEISTIHNAAPG